jgi:hypothetical protein
MSTAILPPCRNNSSARGTTVVPRNPGAKKRTDQYKMLTAKDKQKENLNKLLVKASSSLNLKKLLGFFTLSSFVQL